MRGGGWVLTCKLRGGGAVLFEGGRGNDLLGVGDVGDALRSCTDAFFSKRCGLATMSLEPSIGVGRATGMLIDPLSMDLRRSREASSSSTTCVARPDGIRLACGLAGSTVRRRAMLGESRMVGRSSMIGGGVRVRGMSMMSGG